MTQYETPYTPAPEIAPPQPESRGRWPLAGVMLIDLVVILVLVFVLVIVITAVWVGVSIARNGGSRPSSEQVLASLGPIGFFVILAVQNAVCALVPVFRIAVLRRERLATIGLQARNVGRLILIGGAMGAAVLALNIASTFAFRSIGIEQDQAEQFKQFASLKPGDYIGQTLFFLAGAVIAPIGEETLFRGYVFNAIRQTFSAKPWGLALAYIGSSLLFSSLHIGGVSQGAVALLVPLFGVALILAWGVHYTGSIVPGVIAHAINNSLGLLALLACINNPGVSGCPGL